MEQLKASLDSQLGTALCEAEDTGEMFWLREQNDLDILVEFRPDMKVGHHTAYRDAVSLFAGEIAVDAMMRELTRERDELNGKYTDEVE